MRFKYFGWSISGIILMSLAISKDKVDTAEAFINSLDADQKSKALLEFNDQRTNWHFLPSTMFERRGIFIKDLDDKQRQLLHNLLQGMKGHFTRELKQIYLNQLIECVSSNIIDYSAKINFISIFNFYAYNFFDTLQILI